jgi:hypothetical protein
MKCKRCKVRVAMWNHTLPCSDIMWPDIMHCDKCVQELLHDPNMVFNDGHVYRKSDINANS